MGVETQPSIPVWLGKFAHAKGTTTLEHAIGAVAYTYTIPADCDGLLVQAQGGDVYWRMDGAAATTNSYILKDGDPPVIFPVVQGTSIYRFLGAAAGSVLVIQPITVH